MALCCEGVTPEDVVCYGFWCSTALQTNFRFRYPKGSEMVQQGCVAGRELEEQDCPGAREFPDLVKVWARTWGCFNVNFFPAGVLSQ